DTQSECPADKTINLLFEEQAERSPGDVALVHEGQALTYRQLNCRANQLARHLRKLGVGPGALVGVSLQHSFEMVIAVMGVLKSGAAYVPLEPAHPKGRAAFILKDARVAALLTQKDLAQGLETGYAKVVCLDEAWNVISQESEENLSSAINPCEIAYVIYTSGSTGTPKGVRIQHRSLVNYILWAAEIYLEGGRGDFALYSSLAFDLTVTSIYTPLVTGNRAIIYGSEREYAVLRAIEDKEVKVLKLTPSHLSLIKDRDNRASAVKRLIVGGEALETQLARQTYDSFGGSVEIYNEYGPTEATVGCMIYRFDPEKDRRAYVPIGKPAANTQIYILDDLGNPVAENMTGELCIAGHGLAEGYLNRDELTSERFVENPYSPGTKMYRSGDLARWLPGAEVDFIGRRDEQVKFKGYRVELNETASALRQHPDIRESVVLMKRDAGGEDVMVAYYVSRNELEAADLRRFLRERIIEETIPNIFAHLKKMPLTLNGKANYQALPGLDEVRKRIKTRNTAARTASEEVLAAIWAEVLGISEVGIDDNFFELGGHSLLATRLISRAREVFGVDLAPKTLFESPTVAELARSIDAASSDVKALQVPPIGRAPRNERVPLSFAQQR
ncbi:MAG TPA: non-ribosomal peptide synthetase, partial [Blastocatellia bacterium]